MLRQRVKVNETDRFIAARSSDRERMIDRYKIKDENKLEVVEEPTSCKSAEPKTRTPLIIKDKKQIQDKLYLTLLKTQLFKMENATENKPVRQNNHLSNKKRRRSTENREVSNLLVRKINQNIQINQRESINLGLISTPLNLNRHVNPIPSPSVKIIRKLNFNTCITETSKKIPQKRQKLDVDALDFDSGNQFKSSFKELVNFDLSNEDSFSYGILNKKNISTSSYKILDAPKLKDNFYHNLLDWSKKGVVAVGIESNVYLWDSYSSATGIVRSYENDIVTSLSWLAQGEHILIGHDSGKITIWDIVEDKKVHSYQHHTDRVGCFSGISPFVFSSGSMDHSIHNYDLRTKEVVLKFSGHSQEVCGLKWSHDGKMLASGGNDNKLMLWSMRKSTPEKKFCSHVAAIKAISWSYHQFGLLASGGGSHDRTIKFWNTNTMTMVDSIDTNSQVCNIAFSKITNELVSTHGYCDNLILVWDYAKLEVVATLKGHRDRVIYMGTSPDGTKIVTGAGDESVRFWEVFKTEKHEDKSPFNLQNFKMR